MYKDKINIKQFLIFLFVVGVVAVFNIKNVEAATGADNRNRDVQVTREITLTDVKEFEELEKEINNIQGAVILQNSGDSNSSQYMLLIPGKYFDENLDKLLKYGTVKSDTRNQTDITNEVTILEKSIASNKKHKEVILSMIGKSKTIDSIIEFEQYLMEVEIEQTDNENKLSSLSASSNYTTLSLSIEREEETQVYTEDSFISRLGDAFTDSATNTISFFENLIVAISYVLIPLVFVAIIIAVVIRLRKRGKANEEK